MTLIACFNGSLIDPLAACLRLLPDKLILLGDVPEDSLHRCTQLLHSRGLDIRVEVCQTQGKDLSGISTKLANTVRAEADCVIDLTGGNALVVMAAGAMLSALDSNQRRNITVQIFDRQQNTYVDCDGDRRVFPGHQASLTVEDLIYLHGGTIHPGSAQPAASCAARDLEPLWNIVAAAPRDWNRSISALCEFESRSDSKTDICLSLSHLRNAIHNYEEKEILVLSLLEQFQKRGIIDDRSSRNTLKYTYTSPLFRFCTQKAGNVLEVKTLLEARTMTDSGSRYFEDCRMGVSIDWDGVLHPAAQRIPETRNEVDVVLIHGMTPLFVSCKNGSIGEEELYKLHTVATRFGGPNARKMLVATDLEMKNRFSDRAFIQRAWDMDVYLVTDAAELSREEWKAAFRAAMG